MKKLILITHKEGAPLLRLLGMGPNNVPSKGVEQIQKLLHQNTSWAKKRSKRDLKLMLLNSNSISTLWIHRKLVGFGRATSDKIFRAVLWDVVICKNYRKNGFGKIIVDTLLESPSVKSAKKVYLMTTNCMEFYNKCGFKSPINQYLLQKENFS